MRSSSGSYVREPTGAHGTSSGPGGAEWLLSTLPLPAAGAARLQAALALMATYAAGSARCTARLRALDAIRPRRPDYDDDAEACRIARREATGAQEAAHEVLLDVVHACRAGGLPPERVIRLVREMSIAIACACPDLQFDEAIRLDAEVVQWTIAAYYQPD